MANDHAMGRVTKRRWWLVSDLRPINNKARLRRLNVLREKKEKMGYYLVLLKIDST
jgi:hypothetical protein